MEGADFRYAAFLALLSSRFAPRLQLFIFLLHPKLVALAFNSYSASVVSSASRGGNSELSQKDERIKKSKNQIKRLGARIKKWVKSKEVKGQGKSPFFMGPKDSRFHIQSRWNGSP